MQEELEAMRPLLEEAAKETEVTMETIKVRKTQNTPEEKLNLLILFTFLRRGNKPKCMY